MSARKTRSRTIGLFATILSSAPLASAQVTFSTPVTYASGTSPYALASGDLNGDGKPDLVVANFGIFQSNDNGSTSIFIGNGDGTFQTPQVILTGANPASLALGDFNRDGKLDIAVEDGGEPSVYILLGKGDGSFAAPVKFTFGANANFPTQIATADLDGDGKLDLAIANNGDNSVTILRGNGDGTFQPPVSYPVNGEPHAIVIADFNNDKKLDIAVVNQTQAVTEEYNGTISLLFGNGDGTFQSPIVTDIGGRSFWLAAADLNNDQNLDVLVTVRPDVFAPTKLLLLTGNGDGTFAAPQPINSGAIGAPGFAYASPALADFNKDGKLDVATVLSKGGPGIVRVFSGNGSGTFQSAQDISFNEIPYALISADLNGDGLPDIVTANEQPNISVILNASAPTNPPDFSLTPSALQLSVKQGGEATDSLTITPQNGAFTDAIDLTCSVAGFAPSPFCGVLPASLVPGENPTTATLSITVSKTASLPLGWINTRFVSFSLLVLDMIAICLVIFFFASHERSASLRNIWKVSILAILLIFLPAACGGGGSSTQTNKQIQSQTYTVTVTASSQSIQHSATVFVTVQ